MRKSLIYNWWLSGGIAPYVYSDEYLAVLANATSIGATPPSEEIDKISEDTFIRRLKNLGVWNLADQIFFLGSTKGDGLFSLINIKNPGVRNGTNVSASFTSGNGWLGNGTSQYLRTNFVPSTHGSNLTLNNVGVIFYTPTSQAGSATAVDFGGAGAAGVNAIIASIRTNTNQIAYRLNNNANEVGTNSESRGIFHFKRTASNALSVFRDKVLLDSGTTASSSLCATELYILAYNNNGTPAGYSTKVGGFWMLGSNFDTYEFNLAAYISELYAAKETITQVSFSNWKDFTNDKSYFLSGGANLASSFSSTPTINQEYLVGSALSNTSVAYQGCALAENDCIYAAPSTSVNVLKINTLDDTYSEFGTVAAGVQKYGGAVYSTNGKVYFCPQAATAVMTIDTNNGDTISYFDTTGTVGGALSGNLSGLFKWYGIYQGQDGRLYCIPYRANAVMVIDPSDDSISFIDTAGSVAFNAGNLTDDFKWDGGTVYGQYLYGSPSDATDFLKIDTLNGTCSRFGSVPSGTAKWAISTVGVNDFIYIFPYYDNRIIKLNPADDTFVYTAATIGSINTDIKVGSASTMPDGRILLAPSTPVTASVFNTSDDSVTSFGANLGSGSKIIGGCVAKNGAHYSIPYSYTRILKHSYTGKIIDLDVDFVLNRNGRYS